MSDRVYSDGRRYTCPWCRKEGVTFRGSGFVPHTRPGERRGPICAGSGQHPSSYDGPRKPHWRKRADLDSPEAAEILREFYEVARTLRGFHPVDHPARWVSEELTDLLADLYKMGVSCESMDAAMGARPGTARMRLKRHGYMKLPPSMEHARYKGVQTAPRRRGSIERQEASYG